MNKDELKKVISEYLKNGATLPEIQKLLDKEHGAKMTFMELRLIASELESIKWESLPGEKKAEEKPKTAAAAVEDEDDGFDEEKEIPEDKDAWSSGTVVEINKIARPGAVLSGSVKFASGASAQWVLDQFGRLMFENAKGKPTKEDLVEFQEELQKKVSGGR